MLDLAKKLLDEGDCTLVVVNGMEAYKFYRRGVTDLANLLDQAPYALLGASVADKVIGKAAAALMIEGRICEVYSRVMTRDAAKMFACADIPFAYGELTDMVLNRVGDGRCPLDTFCAPLSSTSAMKKAIFDFLDITHPSTDSSKH